MVVEASRRHPPQPVEGLVVVDERRYGETVIHRFEFAFETGSEHRMAPGPAEADDEPTEDEETA